MLPHPGNAHPPSPLPHLWIGLPCVHSDGRQRQHHCMCIVHDACPFVRGSVPSYLTLTRGSPHIMTRALVATGYPHRTVIDEPINGQHERACTHPRAPWSHLLKGFSIFLQAIPLSRPSVRSFLARGFVFPILSPVRAVETHTPPPTRGTQGGAHESFIFSWLERNTDEEIFSSGTCNTAKIWRPLKVNKCLMYH